MGGSTGTVYDELVRVYHHGSKRETEASNGSSRVAPRRARKTFGSLADTHRVARHALINLANGESNLL